MESQTERSQHANRDKAMKRLKAMLAEAQAAKARRGAGAETRKLQVGSGDRSQRIRTYNFPQGRITDHRVEGLTLYDLPNVLEGNLDALVDRLQPRTPGRRTGAVDRNGHDRTSRVQSGPLIRNASLGTSAGMLEPRTRIRLRSVPARFRRNPMSISPSAAPRSTIST